MEIGKNIAKKMVALMKECSYIQKDATNEHFKYRYVSAAAVLEKVNSACAELGLATITTPKIISTDGKIATVEVTITVVDCESGETLTLTGIGSGQDTGDKAVMKAQTAALKYAWLMSLQISTGDDPEADAKPDQQGSKQPVTQPQAQERVAPATLEKGASIQLLINAIAKRSNKNNQEGVKLRGVTPNGEVLEYWFRGSEAAKIAQLRKGDTITGKHGYFKGPKGEVATLWQPKKVS